MMASKSSQRRQHSSSRCISISECEAKLIQSATSQWTNEEMMRNNVTISLGTAAAVCHQHTRGSADHNVDGKAMNTFNKQICRKENKNEGNIRLDAFDS